MYTGLLYGLSSAVLSFNRLPTLLVAAARRVLASGCGAYFDDLFDLAVRVIASSSQEALLHILASAPPAPDKTQPLRANFGYLGASFDFSMVLDDGVATCGPTYSAVQKIRDAVDLAAETDQLSPAQAAKLRGQAGWTGSLLMASAGVWLFDSSRSVSMLKMASNLSLLFSFGSYGCWFSSRSRHPSAP